MGGVFRILVPLLVVAVAATVWWGSFGLFRSEEIRAAEARLSLYRSTTLAELERFSHLTFVLSRDPFVIETAGGGDTGALDLRFRAFAERAGIDAIYLMNASGVTIAASNAGTPQSFLGQDYSFRPYFQTALGGTQGQFYGIGATTGLPGYFYADAVRGDQGELLGVIAIKIDLSKLQDSWRASGERVILANGDGVVLLSSEPDWRYRTLTRLSAAQASRIAETRQFPGQGLPPLDWAPTSNQSARIGGETLLHLVAGNMPNDWALHYFAPADRAVQRSWLVVGSLLLLAGAVWLVLQIQRTRRIRAALRRSEHEEAELRRANDRLAIEIEERRAAEQRLKKTQSELERAGRLAALGQLSASVTHELGQPIAAMKNHLAVSEMQGGTNGQTAKLQSLVDRMEGITRQLKFFARKGRDDMEAVDLRQAMQAALDLVQPNIETQKVEVETRWPKTPVRVRANRLRLEQVMTNLIRNAVDAMVGAKERVLEVSIGEGDGETVWFEVADLGHGLGERSFDELREPFATTRESGQGMGLGLTISAGIVDDLEGSMTAKNRSGGGAVFRVSLPKLVEEAAT